MKNNPVIQTMLDHKSIRKYTDEMPSDEVIETIVRAGQQAPFAYQSYSVLLSRNGERNPYKAPLLFTICLDPHKFEHIMTRRNWKLITNDLAILILGIQDAHNFIDVVPIKRDSGVPIIRYQIDDLPQRGIYGCGFDLGSGYHDGMGYGLLQIEDPVNHIRLFIRNEALCLTFGHEALDLFSKIGFFLALGFFSYERFNEMEQTLIGVVYQGLHYLL